MFKEKLNKIKNKQRICVYVSLFFGGICILLFMFGKKINKEEFHKKNNKWIYGITVDDSWYERVDVRQIVNAIKDMPVKPTVRIVMSKDISPKEYKQLFLEISKEAYVMASPVDSYYMNFYKDKESYLKRFQETYDELSDYIDIWEIGNEINGIEWIKQSSELIIDKIAEANEFIKEKEGKTAITLYYTNPGKEDMFEWISGYFSDHLTQTIDYVLISYYEDDNDGYQPEWEMIFSTLETFFPRANLGIGECGNTSEDATVFSKANMARAYYTMKSYSENFVGGYFWWNWVQDCVPHKNNKVYEEINRCIKAK